jgi:SPP1 gp7 family putative phage head morphogenesis protein
VPDLIPEPIEAQKFLARKKVVETERWDELKNGEHAHVFTVAHSRNAHIADDIFGLMKAAQEEGKSINDFKKEMRGLMEDKGWYGRSDKGPNDKDYINFRIKAIYHTNMRTSYSAGKYRKQVRDSSLRPIWQYLSKMVGNRREDHKALHNKAFRWDDPFWNENYPPNGWGCDCSVVSLSEAGAKGVDVLDSKNLPNLINGEGNPVDWKNIAPKEWQYNPGQEALIPNFEKYKFECFGDDKEKKAAMVDAIKESLNDDMKKCRLKFQELIAIKNEMEIREPADEEGYARTNPIMYLAGTIGEDREKAMKIKGRNVMICGQRIYHSFVTKNEDQRVPKEFYEDIYEMTQNPQMIHKYNFANPEWGDEFHFSKEIYLKIGSKYYPDAILNIVLKKKQGTAMQIITMALLKEGINWEYDGFTELYKSPGGIRTHCHTDPGTPQETRTSPASTAIRNLGDHSFNSSPFTGTSQGELGN